MTPGCAGRSTEPDLHKDSRGRGKNDNSCSARSGQASFPECRYGAPRNSKLLMLPEALFFVARGNTKHRYAKCIGWAGEVMAPDFRSTRTNKSRKILAAGVGELNDKLAPGLRRRCSERHRCVAAE